jgi:hypothetical protein
MNKHLGLLVAQNLNLDLFYSTTISEYEISLQGHNTAQARKHLIGKGFIQHDYLYGDNKNMTEFKNHGIRVTLVSKTK